MKTVVLCTNDGKSLGTEEIIGAHTNGGQLHKAFSVLIFNKDTTKILIQKRADEKMLWAKHWSNTCCSHPKEEKTIEQEAATRLQEECGFTCPLSVQSAFTYKEEDPNGNGTEHEYDTILIGAVDESVTLNPDPREIAEMKWVYVKELQNDMINHPKMYTPWFHQIMDILS